ncbi:unnamed protein product [Zymoseptoria tritici ST99CH_1A5]|uniref:Uncharacterized protein n=2 Tax=Zymoseptoria tritici TaxID=1047171 RepID=A0A2H1H8P7_ZYMTR|nr:unnamed protein product [Zymoseptoria tritici ST99CH_1E4]SMR64680.1 unnamed protein product [Zymoseptoria tritici ST99CH_3D1]SMY30011.1 unnamed protein product [Zymoseptoria tritici ST99CH_1A5]
MVLLTQILVSFATMATTAHACGGWIQCKTAKGDHCCVIDPDKDYEYCPGSCGGDESNGWPPQCIGTITGKYRHKCSCTFYFDTQKWTCLA